ncbi:hypothetical protein RchiOBHm_Chr7g0194031 [Rosa chinensis]|uniref:Transmembrane protein n=1 Tax=Rosa chinensis TaxID=74649 RepID=A0A2P6P5Z4_ROSCH|nr:hypothetical protein RchiOBHm_Chr7g0194031 [Rosa chinensis]
MIVRLDIRQCRVQSLIFIHEFFYLLYMNLEKFHLVLFLVVLQNELRGNLGGIGKYVKDKCYSDCWIEVACKMMEIAVTTIGGVCMVGLVFGKGIRCK